MRKKIMKIFFMALVLIICVNIVNAIVELDGVSFDPAVIVAGDEVDITLNLHDRTFSTSDIAQNKDATLSVYLEPVDTVSKEFLIITDATGSANIGHLFAQGIWRKTFRVKVKNDAPASKYKLRARFQYIVDNKLSGADKIEDFFINVKKEGIILGVANIATSPTAVRPGDDFVELTTYIENTGNKNAKSIEALLTLPSELEYSYTNNNRLWVGKLNVNESKEATFFINVDEDAASKKYDLELTFNYMDLDDNKYSKKVTIPFLVKERPNIAVVDVKGEGKADSKITLVVTLKNTGTEDAEAVDARIIKQSSQPFSFDLRSNYVGELKVGETGKAVFTINIDKEAEQKEHSLKLLIRVKGDSDKGDNNIYMFNRRATINVDGKKTNLISGMFVAESSGANKVIGSGIVLAIVIIGLVIFKIAKREKL
ncbi:hypothetical protein HYU06_00185 [Candidatus Woesearchaeota archaeon]|nr:hypothetical protein [Candidatus Woesearchaeota archaeon]